VASRSIAGSASATIRIAMIRSVAFSLLLVQLPAAVVAGTCEQLREQVETTIRAAGVERFTVSIVDASASVPGKVVGNCEAGTKKLVYVKGDARGAVPQSRTAPAASAPAKARKPAPMITECKDGSQPADGVCR
jgi:hypothetical protein